MTIFGDNLLTNASASYASTASLILCPDGDLVQPSQPSTTAGSLSGVQHPTGRRGRIGWSAAREKPMSEAQGAFVLVHGGHAGAWVWDDLRPLLDLPSLAIDLPGHGSRPGILATLSIAECVQAIAAELPRDKQLILVGHSLGTAIVLVLADQVAGRVAHVVCLAGPVPRPGESIVDSFPWLMRIASRFVLWFSGREFSQSRGMSERTFFNGMPPARVRQACDRLTPESSALVQEPVQWSGRPPAACTYVKCLRDQGPLSPRHQERMAANLGSGVKVVALDTCHYAMLDRTGELAAALNQIARSAKLSSAEPDAARNGG
jgi:pimeloyl-ACP methyl ester carboxylesterase